MKAVADQKGLLTQAWSAFGIDAAVWLADTCKASEADGLYSMKTHAAVRQLVDRLGPVR